ncbi:MAG: nucleolar RNA-binding Nop10p family protein [Candidatus Micrarchaeota archaeon]
MNKLQKCRGCFLYTFEPTCAKCLNSTSTAHPPRYSKEDKYALYRRREKFAV